MPAEHGRDAERFAAAVEQGRPPGSADAELVRDLEIVAMLRSRAAAYAPHPQDKERARQRLLAALAEPVADCPPRPPAPTAEEHTAPLGPIPTPPLPLSGLADTQGTDLDASAVTAQLPVVSDTGGEPVRASHAGRSRRSGRHTLPTSAGPSRPPRNRGSERPAGRGVRRRVVLVGSAALVMMVALAGTGVFASRDTLPGDALYSVKRAAESAGLALTVEDDARAQRHLELATTRLDEVEQMVARPASAGAPDAELLRSTIDDFGTATGEGSRTLLGRDDAGGAAALGGLREWATEQSARLSGLRSALPGPAAAEADDSIALLDRLIVRTEALAERAGCTEMTSGRVDDLGGMPAVGECAPRPVDPADRQVGVNPSAAGDTRTVPDGAEEGSRVGPGGAAEGSSAPAETDPPQEGPARDSRVPPTRTDPQLLPELGQPDIDGLPGRVGIESEAGPSSTTPAGEQTSTPGSRQLLPPITLPPLIPGQRGITIG